MKNNIMEKIYKMTKEDFSKIDKYIEIASILYDEKLEEWRNKNGRHLHPNDISYEIYDHGIIFHFWECTYDKSRGIDNIFISIEEIEKLIDKKNNEK